MTASAEVETAPRFRSRPPRTSCALECLTPADGQWFFGYYDKRPWSADGTRLLAHRARILDRTPTPQDVVELCVINLAAPDRPFKVIARSTLWNWQQGAMLQWAPGAANEVIYNVRAGDPGAEALRVGPHGAGVLHDLDSGARRTTERPLYVVSPKGDVALSLSFARLAANRPDYGHEGVADAVVSIPEPEQDGVYRIDLKSGRAELILSIAQIAAREPVPMGEGRTHWVNHLMINPSGSRFCFLHRFWRTDGNMHTRFFTCAMDGSDLRLVMQGMVSHYDWLDDHTIVAWAGERKLLAPGASRRKSLMHHVFRALKPVYYALGKPRWMMRRVMGDSYMLLHDDARPNEKFAQGQLTTDGHCTVSRDRAWLLTDGYTVGDNELPLFLYRMPGGPAKLVGHFPTPRELDGPVRCDLHPRLSPDATRLCVDGAWEGRRAVYSIDVSHLTNEGRHS